MSEGMIPILMIYAVDWQLGGYIEEYTMVIVNRGYVGNKRQEPLNAT